MIGPAEVVFASGAAAGPQLVSVAPGPADDTVNAVNADAAESGSDSRETWVLRSARELPGVDQLTAESWAGLWLGEAWRSPGEADGESSIEEFLTDLAAHALDHPGPVALAAVQAFRLVAPLASRAVLDHAVEALASSGEPSAGAGAGAADTESAGWSEHAWTVVEATRWFDPWDCERFLILTVAGPVPHCLLVAVNPSLGGVEFIRLMDVEHGQDFFVDWPAGLPPLHLDNACTGEVMIEAATVLRLMDAAWPREVDDDTATYRALVWSRCLPYRRQFPERPHLGPDVSHDLARDFLGREPAGDSESFCVELFLDFGDGYMKDPLAWSPHWVARFMLDFVPRTGVLMNGDEDVLPDALRRWVSFVLTRRGVPDRWITPVRDAVSTHESDFLRMIAEAE